METSVNHSLSLSLPPSVCLSICLSVSVSLSPGDHLSVSVSLSPGDHVTGDKETIKNYIKNYSQLLSYARSEETYVMCVREQVCASEVCVSEMCV